MTANASILPTAPRTATLRNVAAVLAGLATNVIFATATDAILRGVDVFPPIGQPMSDPLYLLALLYRIAYGVLAGWVTARLAATRPLRAALVLGAIGTVLSVLGVVAWVASDGDLGSLWYAVMVAATALPSTWLGARRCYGTQQ